MSGNVNQEAAALWPNDIANGDEDFADFLDLGDFGLNFSQFGMEADGSPSQQQQQQPPHTQAQQSQSQNGASADITMEDFSNLQQSFNGANSQPPQHMQHLQVQRQSLGGQNLGLATVFEHPHSQQGMYSRAIVPPTPSSLELHAGAHNMSSFLESGNMYQNMGGDPMMFTPLVSPAVTPLDTSFRVPEYSVSGAYFSPLTSPALDAQAFGYMQRKLPKSPVEPAESSNLNPKKTARRKSVTGRTPARVVRQSPSMKPQPGRRKPAPPVPSLELTDAAIAEITSQSPRTPASRKGALKIPAEHHMPFSRDSSSADSISPEPLSESLMPPPPAPNGKSPMLAAQQNQEASVPSLAQPTPNATLEIDPLPAQKAKGKPATPASLMNIPKGLAPKGSSESLKATIVSSIPEKRPSSGSTTPLDEQMTPRLSAVKRSSANATPISSPMIEPKAAGSESLPPSGSLKARKDAKGHSKRGSISASPALQPRISPSIKPLLPEGLSASQSALILASKSNYEHIVSGNHSQLGLSYPEHLATNLTHKRTSHKIAEQGRRNRINNALAEIASLLPRRAPEKNGESGVNAQSGSKASTVELAIEYIKELQDSLSKTALRLAEVEAELAAVKLDKGMSIDQPDTSAQTAGVPDDSKTDMSPTDA
ncbi:hypothetical protein H072_2055 [Dactylellina haptotyla CBS 200.50]|uniref:BHLH domain-containing protein n=1 Tax=Dactylellina haptotyla (strain CBS 200.50) TaxID=1284197 RepID=S8AM66_DACHA|nr:hypothetical protein H072_2055 [Dactylellina haptotyla CBS 200.50]